MEWWTDIISVTPPGLVVGCPETFAPAGRGTQLAQEKPLEQLEADGQATSGDPEVLAKLDNRRSTLLPSQFGHFTPSLPAPIFCRREKSFPHSLH